MTYTTPHVYQQGEPVYAVDLNRYVRDNLNAAFGARFGARSSKAASTAAGTISGLANDFDGGGMWNGANTDRLTAPSDGFYLASASSTNAVAATAGGIQLTRSNGDVVGDGSDGSNCQTMHGAMLAQLAAGDFFTVVGRAITGVPGFTNTILSLTKLVDGAAPISSGTWSTPYSFSANDITAPGTWKRLMVDDLSTVYGPPRVIAQCTAAIAYTGNIERTVPLDSTATNPNGMWDGSANTRVTAALAGLYVVSGRVTLSGVANRVWGVHVAKNGNYASPVASYFKYRSNTAAFTGVGSAVGAGALGFVRLAAGDYLELRYTSGGSQSIATAELAACWMAP